MKNALIVRICVSQEGCRVEDPVTTVCLSFHPMAKEHVHALKGLAYCKRVAAASSPAATCKQDAALTSPARTLAAAPGFLAHASVTEIVKLCPMGP